MGCLQNTAFSILLSVGLVAAAQAARPYTVDDMLAVEEFGRAIFDANGDRLVFEYFRPYDQQADYSRYGTPGQTRSVVYGIDLREPGAAEPLFAQSLGEGYTIDRLSPDGRMVLFDHVSTSGFAKGLADLSTGEARFLDLSPAVLGRLIQTPWTADGRLTLSVANDGRLPSALSLFAEDRAQLIAKWRRMRAGEVPTASKIGSGRFVDLDRREMRLVSIDATRGGVRELSADFPVTSFSEQALSPDQEILAAPSAESLAPESDVLVSSTSNFGGKQKTLTVFDMNGDARPNQPCVECDVLHRSLHWSSDGRRLAFFARHKDGDWNDGAYYVFDRRTGRASRIDLGDLRPTSIYYGILNMKPAAWIGDHLAILATSPDAAANDDTGGRADWRLVTDGAILNLTKDFKGSEAPELIAMTRDSLVLVHDGEVWTVDAQGERVNLTEDIADKVRAWRAPLPPYGVLPENDLRPVDAVVVETGGVDGAPKTALFINLKSGAVQRVVGPSLDARIVATATKTSRAAFIERAGNGVTRLVVAKPDDERREVMRINAHLAGVVGGTPVRIDHPGPDGDQRTSWLLLPPFYEKGDPLATVVNVYPGWTGRKTFTRFVDRVHALNNHILAAHGYAVLFPSLPVDYNLVPRDPLDGLVEEVFAAVDAAAREGYVDLDRLAVQGQSYGGYTVGALVGMTDRFKSAVAKAGPYNLISQYGVFDIRRRLTMESDGHSLFSVGHLESYQGGMGAAPWEDTARYLRNSPLMHVENIETPIMLMHGDYDLVNITQAEEFFTALMRLNKDAVFVRYFGEGHVYQSPANIRDMWARIFDWYEETLGSPAKMAVD